MPTYEAWIPVVARIKTTLYLENSLSEEGIRNQSDFIERFREEGDFEVNLCSSCNSDLRIDTDDLAFEEVSDNDVVIVKIED